MVRHTKEALIITMEHFESEQLLTDLLKAIGCAIKWRVYSANGESQDDDKAMITFSELLEALADRQAVKPAKAA